jgi:hypothetical protein
MPGGATSSPPWQLKGPLLLCLTHLPPGGGAACRQRRSALLAVRPVSAAADEASPRAAPAAGWAARHLFSMRAGRPQTPAISLRSWRYAQHRARASAAHSSGLRSLRAEPGNFCRPPAHPCAVAMLASSLYAASVCCAQSQRSRPPHGLPYKGKFFEK